jgi:hypothetical protein
MRAFEIDAAHDSLDWGYIDGFCCAACEQYRKTAPTVCEWVDGLYVRMQDAPERVSYFELLHLYRLRVEGQWEPANYAANRIYKVMDRLGQDTTGHAGF